MEQMLSWDVYLIFVFVDIISIVFSQCCENIGIVDIDLIIKYGKFNVGLQKGQNVKCFVDMSLDVLLLFGKMLVIKFLDGIIFLCGIIW